MSNKEIRNQVAEEIALQDSMGNKIGQRMPPLPPEELSTADEHAKFYLTRLEAQDVDHSIVVSSLDELSQVFDVVEELAGGRYTTKNAILKHEAQHGEAAERLGQRYVRFMAHLAIGAPFNLPDGRRVRSVGITPYTLLEDVQASRLGVGLFLGFPGDTTDAVEDTNQIQSLGYKDADEVIRRAADYNAKTRSDTYPLPRRSS